MPALVNVMAEMTLISNPNAGAGAAARIEEQIREALKAKGIPFRAFRTEQAGHATELARQAAAEGVGTVLSIGGDGTNLEIAEGLLGSGTAMGLIPAGTGNDLIKTLGIPKNPLEALDYVLNHAPRPMDVGLLNGKPFLNVCGTGFDVSVLDHAERFKKHLRGLLPYMLGLISAIFSNKPIHVTLEEPDSKPAARDILICTIANGRYIGGGIPICPAAAPDDGMLDLVTVESIPRLRIFRYLPGLMGAKILSFDITQHRLCRAVTLISPGMRLQIDGEIHTMDKAVFSLAPGALSVHW